MNAYAISFRQIFRHVFAIACLALALFAVVMTWLVAISPDQSDASSHREAPLISEDPAVDNLDVYAFVSPDVTNTVTLIATWIPFEEPGGGPNFYHFDPNARYLIKIDRDGNAIADITYEWTFSRVRFDGAAGKDTFLYNTNQIGANYDSDADFNIRQYYTVTKITADTIPASTNILFANQLMPPDNIGPRSTPNYANITANAVNTAGGYKEFTGQRDDPFYVDVRSIFDLAGLRPFNNLHLIPLSVEAGQDVLAGYNAHATALQVPISELVPGTCNQSDLTDNDCVIGVWSTAERRATVTYGGGTVNGSGGFVQVSRLGNPLVNEVVLDLELKDAFNAIPPTSDGAALSRVLNSELAALVNLLYPATANVEETGRTDLQIVFLNGIPTAPGYPMTTQQNNSDTTPSEQLRLNVAVKPTLPACQGDQLGLFNDDPVDGDDLTAWPNGRRLEDDVTDMAIRAVAQGYGPVINGVFGGIVPQFKNLSPNNALGDGVEFQDKAKCLPNFPYMGTPFSGYENSHDVVLSTDFLPIIRKNN
ncbi:MAG TPA: DUF4331 domain-containing protein [Anaerolineae bacterium]|nr:DUF4331 domain-containing protein [Anaerolineae bacterium]